MSSVDEDDKFQNQHHAVGLELEIFSTVLLLMTSRHVCAKRKTVPRIRKDLLDLRLRPEETMEEEAKKTNAADQDISVERSLLGGLGSADVASDSSVPIIDLKSPNVQEQLWEAAVNVGFFTIVNHGISEAVIDNAFRVSREFFALSVEEKEKASPFAPHLNSGFEHKSQVRPSTGLADQKESLQITARKLAMDERWPNEDFKESTQILLKEAHSLAGKILDLLEPLATPTLAAGTLKKSHTLWGDTGQCTLRMLHYMPMDPETNEKLQQAGYWRAGSHTDWDNVTLLFQRPGENGLECCANPRSPSATKYWTAVDPVPGGIAVNIGDMLARWSNHRVFSNLHRVRLPVDATKPRYSIGFFAQSDKEIMLEGSTNPISAGDYILSRIQSNFAKDT